MISVIIPTYNEAKNIPELVSSVDRYLSQVPSQNYEVLIMDDDSPDKTADLVGDLGLPKVRAVNRRGRPRGLAHAVIDGFEKANGEIIGVMDADLSHPPSVLPELCRAIAEGADLVVGSRYVPGGGVKNWPWARCLSSRIASWVGRLVTPVRDSTSGFFMFRRSVIDGVVLDPLGFKIGLEVFVKGRHGGRIREVPFVFPDRRWGKSKLTSSVVGCYFKQLFSLWRYRLKTGRGPVRN